MTSTNPLNPFSSSNAIRLRIRSDWTSKVSNTDTWWQSWPKFFQICLYFISYFQGVGRCRPLNMKFNGFEAFPLAQVGLWKIDR